MNNTIPKKMTSLVPPLPLVEEAKDKDEKPKANGVIKFVLKQRAGSTATAPIYKLKATRFCKGLLLRNRSTSKRPYFGALETERHNKHAA
jgi:hypothetical protein